MLHPFRLVYLCNSPYNSHKARHVIQVVDEVIQLGNVVRYRWTLRIQLPQMFLVYLTNACVKREWGTMNHIAMGSATTHTHIIGITWHNDSGLIWENITLYTTL